MEGGHASGDGPDGQDGGVYPRGPTRGANILDPKWVWAIKTKGDGTLEKFKARMVVRGFKQIEGVDFDETYAPVGRYGTARVLLALAAAMDWEVHQMDVTTAFLYGDLEEDIYMRQPEGFNDGSGRMWKLRKSLYGLKQAPRVWNAKLDKVLKELGFEQSILDPALYFLKRDGEIVFILDFVDDMLIVGSAMSIVDFVKKSLCSHFDMKDLGEAEYYLGMNIKRNRSTRELWLGQEKYCAQAIERYGLQGESPVETPMATDFKAVYPHEVPRGDGKDHHPGEGNPFPFDPLLDAKGQREYQSMVGSLMYAATSTRPDISYAVGQLSQVCHRPRTRHLEAVKRVFRYLLGTLNQCLHYSASGGMFLEGLTDAD